MLLKKFKIDVNEIKNKNKELMKKNIIDKLNSKEKKLLNFYKGSQYMDDNGLFSYMDISNYLSNETNFGKIHIHNIKDYIFRYQIFRDAPCLTMNNIENDFNNILKEIQKNRIKAVIKYIKIFDKMFSKGIKTLSTIYRMMNTPFDDNIIKNITSWSLIPLEMFCVSNQCHLYVTKLSKNIKVLYIENNSKDNNLKSFQNFSYYEYEFLLPRNIKFEEVKVIKIKIPSNNFHSKIKENDNNKEISIMVHYINIIEQVKMKDDLYKKIPVTLLT